MSCEANRELLELYALGVLSAEERSEIEEHLQRQCSTCTANLRKAHALNVAILGSLPLQEPSALLRPRIVNSVRPGTSVRRASVVWVGLAMAMALATIYLGLEHRRQADALSTAIAQVRSAEQKAATLEASLNFLRDPQTRPAIAKPGETAPRGTYFVNPVSGIMLIASNLPVPEPGRVYSMWVIPKGQAPQPAGLFRPADNGSAIHFYNRPIDLGAAEALAITNEPESGSPAPTTTPFLVTRAQGL